MFYIQVKYINIYTDIIFIFTGILLLHFYLIIVLLHCMNLIAFSFVWLMYQSLSTTTLNLRRICYHTYFFIRSLLTPFFGHHLPSFLSFFLSIFLSIFLSFYLPSFLSFFSSSFPSFLPFYLSPWSANWLTDILTYSLIDWLTDWLIDWLTRWLTKWLSVRQTDCLTDLLTDWLSDWLTDWPIDWIICCIATPQYDYSLILLLMMKLFIMKIYTI